MKTETKITKKQVSKLNRELSEELSNDLYNNIVEILNSSKYELGMVVQVAITRTCVGVMESHVKYSHLDMRDAWNKRVEAFGKMRYSDYVIMTVVRGFLMLLENKDIAIKSLSDRTITMIDDVSIDDWYEKHHKPSMPSIKPIADKYHWYTSKKTESYVNTDMLSHLNSVGLTVDRTMLEWYFNNAPEKHMNWYSDKYHDYTGKRFYLKHKVDQRNRYYEDSCILKMQSNKDEKSLISFAKSMTIERESAIRWLKIAIADCEGYTYCSFDSRVQYVDNYMDDLRNSKVALTIKYIKEIDAIEAGATSSNTPVGLDVVASGITMQSLLFRCKKTARECGVVLTDEKVSPYKKLRAAFPEKDGQLVKKAGMTHGYGSKSNPKGVFGHQYIEFINIIDEIAPAQKQYIDFMNKIWQKVKHKDSVTYYLAGKKYEFGIYKTLKREYDITYNGTSMWGKINLNIQAPNEEYKGLLANEIHSLDSLILERVVDELKWMGVNDVITNHDCFFVHIPNLSKLQIAYKNTLRWFYEQNFIEELAVQFDVPMPEMGELELEDIEPLYNLC